MIAAALFSEERLRQLSPLVPQLHAISVDLAGLLRYVAEAAPEILILPATDREGWPTAPALVHLRELFPRLPVVILAEFPADRRHMAPLRCVPRVSVISALGDLPDLLVSIVAEPEHRQRIIGAALALVPSDSLRRVCRALASDLTSAGERGVASRLRVSQRTLRRDRRQHEWPTLRALGTLVRTLVAAAHADLPPSLRASVAGYHSTSAMCRARRHSNQLIQAYPHLHFGAVIGHAEDLALGGSEPR